MQKNDSKTSNGKKEQSTSSTYAGKAEKGDISGRAGNARVPSHGSATGATVEREQLRDEEASNAGGQWGENSPGITSQERAQKKGEKPGKAA